MAEGFDVLFIPGLQSDVFHVDEVADHGSNLNSLSTLCNYLAKEVQFYTTAVGTDKFPGRHHTLGSAGFTPT